MIIAGNSDDYILKIFQNALNMFCHDIINPVNSIMICASSPNNSKSFEIIDDCSKKIIQCVNSIRYLYCMTNNEYKIDISQIIRDWKNIFNLFELNFDENIKSLDDFILQIIFHIMTFMQELSNFKKEQKILISQIQSQIKISFEDKFNEIIIEDFKDIIFKDVSKLDLNPMNVNIHFFQYLIKKNNIKIIFNEDEILIHYE
jgi:hypothetical protein